MSSSLKLILLPLLSFLLSPLAAAVDVEPGTTSDPLQAIQCAHASRGLFGGECTVDCDHDCSLPENRAQAYLSLESLDVGSRFITSTVFTEFSVSSTPETAGNGISSSFFYDVGWLGWWNFGEAFVSWNPQVTVTFWVTDRTDGGRLVLNETVHQIDIDSFASIDIIEVGLGRDMDSTSGTSTVNLIRGHTYRAHLSLKLEATATSVGVLTVDYMDDVVNDKRGAWWNELTVSLSPDLAQRIDLLEGRIQILEENLENHTHTYRTGRGAGHNKVDAESSPAIIPEQ